MELEKAIIDRLRRLGAKVVTAESCTGGLVASRLTDVPGSSDVYWGGWVTYDNSAKESLGVPPESIAKAGAVSEDVARALAEAALRTAAHARFAVATTGIAGPGGGSGAKPVGLCFVAVASRDQPTCVQRVQAPGGHSRLENKRFFSEAALSLLMESLRNHGEND